LGVRHLIVGTFLIALGLWGIIAWWEAFAFAMRALMPLGALIVGVLALLSSYSRLGVSVRSDHGSDEGAED
jgi:hypothetical protein